MNEKEGTLMYLEIEALLDEFYKTFLALPCGWWIEDEKQS